jgi:hypothetical protein
MDYYSKALRVHSRRKVDSGGTVIQSSASPPVAGS